MKGFVYIISNKAMPGLFKVGYTDRDPQTRANELSSTANPHPYIVEYKIETENASQVEQAAHRLLEKYREGKEWIGRNKKEGREWFRCSMADCVYAIRQSCTFGPTKESYVREEVEREAARLRAEAEKRQAEEQRKISEKLQEEFKRKRHEKARWTYERNYLISLSVCVFFKLYTDTDELLLSIFLTFIIGFVIVWPISMKLADWHMKSWKDPALLEEAQRKKEVSEKIAQQELIKTKAKPLSTEEILPDTRARQSNTNRQDTLIGCLVLCMGFIIILAVAVYSIEEKKSLPNVSQQKEQPFTEFKNPPTELADPSLYMSLQSNDATRKMCTGENSKIHKMWCSRYDDIGYYVSSSVTSESGAYCSSLALVFFKTGETLLRLILFDTNGHIMHRECKHGTGVIKFKNTSFDIKYECFEYDEGRGHIYNLIGNKYEEKLKSIVQNLKKQNTVYVNLQDADIHATFNLQGFTAAGNRVVKRMASQ